MLSLTSEHNSRPMSPFLQNLIFKSYIESPSDHHSPSEYFCKLASGAVAGRAPYAQRVWLSVNLKLYRLAQLVVVAQRISE